VPDFIDFLSCKLDVMSRRSINPDDYQDLPVAVGVMQKHLPCNFVIAPHSHRRDQLLYAASGTMRVRTETHSWIVPPERALYMPGGVTHSVSMRDPVEMRTLYIEPKSHPNLPTACAVMTPSALLKELIEALIDEPENYDQSDRGLWLGQLILDEVCRGKTLDLGIPLPTDPRLLRVCERVIENPGENKSLADYSDVAAASERTLARICERELGMGFASWRQQVRFHYALEALARGAAIAEIAHDCGYASASAFTAAFSKNFGQPPSRIIRSLSKAH
jgi:AraC-like DNA-binding protein/mannose-6-phosphate isomerase-like protein (cupin superfamily)